MSEISPSPNFSSFIECQLDRVDVFLMRVGSSQVGWHCQDGIVRSLGESASHPADDGENALRQELDAYSFGIAESDKWSGVNWGERFYRHCTDTLGGDFSRVELLTDAALVEDCARHGLKRLILWAIDPQESLWFARLISGKVRQSWHQLIEVNVLTPDVVAGTTQTGDVEVESLQHRLKTEIFPFALQDAIDADEPDRFVLAICNFAGDNAFSTALERCAPSLARQCRVLHLYPHPEAIFETEDSTMADQPAAPYRMTVLGDDNWALDRLRAIAAWRQGWFQEAATRLAAYPNFYGGVLSELARRLTLLSRGETHRFVHDRDLGIESWLQHPIFSQLTDPHLVELWREQLAYLKKHPCAEAWEATFSMERLLQQGSYTRGFLHFAQILEQLLYLQYKDCDWLAQGLIVDRDRPKSIATANLYQPGIKQLISAWCKATRQDKNGSVYRLFDRIGNTRNAILHYGGAIPFDDLLLVWSTTGMPVEFTRPQYIGLMTRMKETLTLACDRNWKIPEPTLGQALSEWGLGLVISHG